MILALLLVILPLLPLTGCGGATESSDLQASDPETSQLQMYVFSAGKADAMLLTTEESAVLVDCGEKGFGQDILAYLESHGITRLDYMIVTHFDQDHVGGAAKIINNFPVGTVLQSNQPKDSEEYEKYVKALSNANITPVTVESVYEFTLDGVRYVVDQPDLQDYREDDSNNSSLMVWVYHGDNTLLLAGDAQTERLEEFLTADPGTCDVLKVPHHGGEEPMMDALVTAVKPKYAVITSSDEEVEDADTVAALERGGAAVYLTRTAPVVIQSDGAKITVAYEA